MFGLKGRHGSHQFTKLLFERGHKFTVPVDTNVLVQVVVTTTTKKKQQKKKKHDKKLPVHCTTKSKCFDHFKN